MTLVPPFPDTRSDTIADFFDLWIGMGNHGRPTLLDFDPRHLPQHLSSYWMARAEPDSTQFRFTYYGHNLSHVVGVDRTGELIPTDHQFSQLLLLCQTSGQPQWRKGPSESETFNMRDITIEVIMLPLFSNSGQTVEQVMGIAKYFNSAGEPLDENSYSSHMI
ncbi:hypothetical protein ACTL6U_03740 [Rhodovibrionaceae bacterium A322]